MSLKRRPPLGNIRRVVAIEGNLRGVMTNKAGRVVQFESFLERSLLLRLDRDRTVRDYGSQPETFQFSDGQGGQHAYTPDFIVWRHDESVEIHEVTLTSRRLQAKIRRREEAAVAVCLVRGWQYIVHTELDLPQGTELANLLALFHYRPSAYLHPAVAQAALAYVADGQSVAMAHLVHQLTTPLGLPPASIIPTLGHLLWHDLLQTDLHQPIFAQGGLASHMKLWLASKEMSSWLTK
jgi:hypothetical protein